MGWDQLPEPPMPTLPAERARPLTATPCLPSATANSALFQRIPAEIRLRILIEAFGGTSMHFDLRLLHPLKKRRRSDPPRHANLDSQRGRNLYKPRRWEWCGSLCHNLSPEFPRISTSKDYYDLSDLCHLGKASDCDYWPGEMPTKCLIGVTGWLLTCRQAYIEGVEVLYGTNRIRIHGRCLLRRLPEFLWPQRRAAIKSVQLYWNIHPYPDATFSDPTKKNQLTYDMESFPSLLKALPAILPNLTLLYLCLQGDFLFPDKLARGTRECDEKILSASETVLQLLDQMIVKLHRLSYCRILLPISCFRARKFKAKGIGFHPDDMLLEEPLWRDIPVQNESSVCLKGYWIAPGEHDWFHPDDYIPPLVPECV